MNRVRLDRLNKLKYMLDNHDKIFPTVEFDIKTWYCNEKNYEGECNRKFNCTTAACALGSAGLWRPFRKAGLRINKTYEWICFKGKDGYLSYNFKAGRDFFGITKGEGAWLFDRDTYKKKNVKPADVSRRVQKLIKEYEKLT